MLLAVTSIHVLLAVFWIGGTLFLVAIAAPVLRTLEPEAFRGRVFREIGLRFRAWGRFAFAGLLGTGVLMLHLRGILRPEVLESGGFWSSAFGRALLWKLIAVGVVFSLSILHEIQSLRADRTEDPILRQALHRRSRGSGRWLGVAFLFLLVAAVRLSVGG